MLGTLGRMGRGLRWESWKVVQLWMCFEGRLIDLPAVWMSPGGREKEEPKMRVSPLGSSNKKMVW